MLFITFWHHILFVFFFSSRRRHTRFLPVSWVGDVYKRQSIPEPELKGYTLDEPLLNLPTEEEERQREENLPTEEDDPENGVIFGD